MNAEQQKTLTERVNRAGQRYIGEVHPKGWLTAATGRLAHEVTDTFTVVAFVERGPQARVRNPTTFSHN